MPCISTRCPGPPAEIQAHNIRNTAVYLIVHMGYFLSLCSPNWGFAAKKLIFSFIWPWKPVPFEVPVVSDNWICWSLFLDEWGEFLLKRSRTTCGDVGAVWQFFKRVSDPETQLFSTTVMLGESFSYSNSPSHRTLGWYRHTSSSRQIHKILY